MTPCYNGCVDTKHLCCAGGKGDLRGMEETERRTESITVRLISKEQFCKIMDAIHEQDKLMDSICKSLERIADIFSFDVDNKYRKALEDLLVYLFDDTSDWIGYWMYEAYWKPFSWWDEQSVEHTVSSHEELYDFLIDNLIAHREAEAKKKNEDKDGQKDDC